MTARRWLRSAIFVVVVLLGVLAGCVLLVSSSWMKRSARAPHACAPCRDGSSRDDLADARVQLQWKRVPPALREGVSEIDLECLCFGTGPSVLIGEENAYLPSDWAPEEQAARGAHLALHRKRPPWNAAPGLGCDARVERALELEADAHALELDVREALLVRTPRYPFESQYLATPVPARRDWLRTHFRAQGERDGVVTRLVLEYRARCPAP